MSRADSDSDTLLACPFCDSAHIEKSGAPSMDGGGRTPEWTCRGCSLRFETPHRRERKGTATLSGMAGRLEAMDPDASEVSE